MIRSCYSVLAGNNAVAAACVCIVCRSRRLPFCLRRLIVRIEGPSPSFPQSFFPSSLALLSLKDGLDLKTRLKRLRDHLAAAAAAAAEQTPLMTTESATNEGTNGRSSKEREPSNATRAIMRQTDRQAEAEDAQNEEGQQQRRASSWDDRTVFECKDILHPTSSVG